MILLLILKFHVELVIDVCFLSIFSANSPDRYVISRAFCGRGGIFSDFERVTKVGYRNTWLFCTWVFPGQMKIKILKTHLMCISLDMLFDGDQ